jgi:hypothetical protein
MTTMRASAQSTNPTVPSMIPEAAAHTIYAKIRAINPLTREVTMDAFDGSMVTVIAAPQVPLENLEVGDRVDAHYYRSVAFLVAQGTDVPGLITSNLPPEQAQLLMRHEQIQVPGGASVPMTHITGLVVGVHPGMETVDVVNPNGGAIYSIQGSGDPSRAAILPSLKVGDVVTAVISPPIATSIEPETGLFSKLSKLIKS